MYIEEKGTKKGGDILKDWNDLKMRAMICPNLRVLAFGHESVAAGCNNKMVHVFNLGLAVWPDLAGVTLHLIATAPFTVAFLDTTFLDSAGAFRCGYPSTLVYSSFLCPSVHYYHVMIHASSIAFTNIMLVKERHTQIFI